MGMEQMVDARTDQRAWALDQLAHGRATPIFDEIPGDLDTPVSVFLKLRAGDPAFLLESVEGGEQVARYSFVGARPARSLRFRDGTARFTDADGEARTETYTDPLDLVAQLLDTADVAPNPGLPRFQGGAVGYLAYDAAANFERLPVPAPDPLGVPDGMFMLCEELVIFDHVRDVMRLVTVARPDPDPVRGYAAARDRLAALADRIAGPTPVPSRDSASPVNGRVDLSMSKAEFMRAVERAKEYISAGDIIQTVPSLRLSRRLTVDPIEVYRALRRINPSPYMFYLDFGDVQLAGASPEMMVRFEDGQVRTRPIAGTRPRGEDPDADGELARELLADPKERAEHVMLVDLGRNDVGRVSVSGSVAVDDFMSVERYSHVMHIVSDVTGTLAPGRSGLDALRACFPAGTLSGAPKIRAMEIIAELENLRRGPYGGAVGYVSYSGDLDTAITIRTMVVRDGMAHVQAGAGIVADSVPEREYHECLNKARALLRAIEIAEEAGHAARAR